MEGSFEFLAHTTSIEAPFLYHKPLLGEEGGGAGTAVEMDGEGVSEFMGGCCCSTRRTSQPRPWLPPHTPYQQPSPPMSIKSIPDAGGVNTPPPTHTPSPDINQPNQSLMQVASTTPPPTHTHTLPRYQQTKSIPDGCRWRSAAWTSSRASSPARPRRPLVRLVVA